MLIPCARVLEMPSLASVNMTRDSAMIGENDKKSHAPWRHIPRNYDDAPTTEMFCQAQEILQ